MNTIPNIDENICELTDDELELVSGGSDAICGTVLSVHCMGWTVSVGSCLDGTTYSHVSPPPK